MGTPDFAVPALQALHDHGDQLPLVVTQPDRPKGRGRRLVAPPVKEKAETLGYPVAQPHSVKDDLFYEEIAALQPDLFVVVAFGHILPQRLLDVPKMGAINIHGSILPKFRGPAPIHRAIIAGETETGVTTMRMDAGLDTGDILLVEKTPIHPNDTTESLHDRMAVLGATVLIKTLERLQSGSIVPVPQNNRGASYAPLLRKTEGKIDWQLPAAGIERLIRGMTPWPGTYTYLKGKRIKIWRATISPKAAAGPPGTVMRGFSDELLVSTGEGVLSILELQGESGKRLSMKDYIRGMPIAPGALFE
jgi:methionyl-tRNA formyltransferase